MAKGQEDWESAKLLEKLPPAGEDDLKKWLYQWARDMSEWGRNVRIDIVRLEGAAGFPSGDPGDPPPPPPSPPPLR